ncbi:MAG: 3-hydroxybutyrate dehydrogenase [Pirellulaceae bacterium]
MPKTILITGAGSGIGRGMACHLSSLGHRVVVSDRDQDTALETSNLIEGHDTKDVLQLDVSCEDSINALSERVSGDPVDVLINNAGIQHVAKLEEFPQATWDTVVDVLLNGVARVTRACLPAMRQKGYGRIINIGSIHSLVASPYKTAYVAAKHGLLGFSKTMALETCDVDVTINTICPGYVLTPLVEKQIAEQAALHGINADEVVEKIMLAPMPKGVFVTTEEMAETAAFLMTEHARNITGQEIVMDGGWTVR